jgi:tetratricopeptide (TPR) repeat protein
VTALRDSLLTALAAGREMEAALLAACDDSPAVAPGAWTVRDHLAHIAHYCDYAADVLDATRTGTPVPEDAEADLDARNARIFAENRGVAAAEAVARANAAHDRLVQAVERCSDDDLVRPRSPESDVPVWRLVPGCAWGHVGQHLAHWHLDRGEPVAAERAARRVHEIDTVNLEDPRQRAAATYNLGCFYATTGRPDEALALVREALTADPDLRDWARQDPDLVSIHHLLPAGA